jgi:hypothetical protein
MGASPENVAARGGRAKRADGSRIAPGEESSGTRVYRRINRPSIPQPGAADQQNKDNDERLRRQERAQFSQATNLKQTVDDQEKAQKAKQLATQYKDKSSDTPSESSPARPKRPSSAFTPAEEQKEQDRKQEKEQIKIMQQENPRQQYSNL